MRTLRFTVKRGRDTGMHLQPHRDQDGTYIASETKYEQDYVRVKSVDPELIALHAQGHSIRMSNPEMPSRGASLIAASSIRVVESR